MIASRPGQGLTATPAAEGWARDCRREDGGDCRGLCPAPTPGPSIPLTVATPLWGSRGRRHPRPGSWYWARERGEGRQVAVGQPHALPPSAVESGAPATGCAPSHTPPLFSSNRSTKASGSSWGPILISGTWAIDGAATGFSSRPSKLRMARRSSFCAWTKSRKRSSSCP